ncbi:MAG TPA: alternative ribosome rescue aminoacyl-tRNA hydrolase ArfB [Bacteroidales bacterium]|nr:alternative ribosome rescue aminoacyl-tRNA hydrolase ArfB [Bacteroidales bacterium]
MTAAELKSRIDPSGFRFSTSRSSGPGGQNVNKVNTKVELRFNINSSPSFTNEEKEIISDRLKNRITAEGDLLIISQSERTQLGNKEEAEEKLFILLAKALTIKPPRKATKPTSASKVKRIETKKKRGYIKSLRKDTGVSE